jgi:hypothetical protein
MMRFRLQFAADRRHGRVRVSPNLVADARTGANELGPIEIDRDPGSESVQVMELPAGGMSTGTIASACSYSRVVLPSPDTGCEQCGEGDAISSAFAADFFAAAELDGG